MLLNELIESVHLTDDLTSPSSGNWKWWGCEKDCGYCLTFGAVSPPPVFLSTFLNWLESELPTEASVTDWNRVSSCDTVSSTLNLHQSHQSWQRAGRWLNQQFWEPVCWRNDKILNIWRDVFQKKKKTREAWDQKGVTRWDMKARLPPVKRTEVQIVVWLRRP